MTVSLHVQSGRIQVSVVDSTGGIIPAQIRVQSHDSGETMAEGQIPQDRGWYLSAPLPVGHYRMKIRASGFRTQVFTDIVVETGITKELPSVAMRLQNCGSPELGCGGIGPPQKPSGLNTTLRVGCPIDLDRKSNKSKSNKKCATETTADLRVEIQDKKMYFVSAGGARFSKVNPESQDCRVAAFTEDRIRVDDLGSGFDLCLKTKRGKTVAIFFTAEVPEGESTIPIYFAVQN